MLLCSDIFDNSTGKQTEAKKGEIKLTKRNRRCHWVDLDFLLELLELFQKNQERKNKKKK